MQCIEDKFQNPYLYGVLCFVFYQRFQINLDTLNMDKKTVWMSTCGWFFVDAVICGICWTLPAQKTECLNSIRDIYSNYFFVKAIILLIATVCLGFIQRCCTLNVIYAVGILNSFWTTGDAYFIWMLFYSCDDKLTDHVGIVIIHVIHLALGFIALVVICIWYKQPPQVLRLQAQKSFESVPLSSLRGGFLPYGQLTTDSKVTFPTETTDVGFNHFQKIYAHSQGDFFPSDVDRRRLVGGDILKAGAGSDTTITATKWKIDDSVEPTSLQVNITPIPWRKKKKKQN
ncbi:hypothetical protein QE152_g38252 [Popillia japonica]|uniref:Transmembrane protein n=1 Tax=Popillia japonica TaxID=7064 RepID=A0AAW1I8E0_POPJA